MSDDERKRQEQAYREWLRREAEATELEDPDAADDIPEEDVEGDDE